VVRIHDGKNRERDEETAVFACGGGISAAAPVPEEVDRLEYEFDRNEHRRGPKAHQVSGDEQRTGEAAGR
jgi:hypothetical protein